MKLLIIEAHKEFRTILRAVLEKQEWDVEIQEAVDPKNGLELAADMKPDIVFLDYGLCNGKNPSVDSLIKARVPNCKIVMLTMIESAEIAKLIKPARDYSFVAKDNLSNRLIPLMRRIIAQKTFSI